MPKVPSLARVPDITLFSNLLWVKKRRPGEVHKLVSSQAWIEVSVMTLRCRQGLHAGGELRYYLSSDSVSDGTAQL